MVAPTNGLTNRERVTSFILAQRPDPLCSSCIAVTLGMRPAAVQRVATLLEGTVGYRRTNGRCTQCRHIRLTVASG